jgi:2-polyprenyl-6-methoxyphenol hydroxylase-like FAD-dependent oxidoreductase
MGLCDELNRAGYHIGERGRRVAGFGTRVFLKITRGRYVTIARSALSRLLIEKIGDGVDMIFGDEIRSLHECEDCVEVELGQRGKRKFDLVVGADGLAFERSSSGLWSAGSFREAIELHGCRL